MKRIMLFLLIFGLMAMSFSSCSSGRIVSEIPPKPKDYPVVKPEGEGWAYISGYYIYDRRFDEYVYVPGRWVKLKEGYYWDEGEWVKK
ncbi:MAG: hypothetical protein D6707_00500, partial [Bacteroidetes bacterium]